MGPEGAIRSGLTAHMVSCCLQVVGRRHAACRTGRCVPGPPNSASGMCADVNTYKARERRGVWFNEEPHGTPRFRIHGVPPSAKCAAVSVYILQCFLGRVPARSPPLALCPFVYQVREQLFHDRLNQEQAIVEGYEPEASVAFIEVCTDARGVPTRPHATPYVWQLASARFQKHASLDARVANVSSVLALGPGASAGHPLPPPPLRPG